MTDVLRDAIARQLTELQRAVPQPVAEGYGRDLSCLYDITDDAREVDPFSIEGIAEAAYRRLDTRRGTNPDDPDYGYDLKAKTSAPMTPSDLPELEGEVRGELLKDDRLLDAQAEAELVGAYKLRLRLRLTPQDPRLGSFELVLAVVNGELLLEAIQGARNA